MTDFAIRAMTPLDWESVREIYAEGIATGIATFETGPPTWGKWDAGHLPFGRFVAEEAGKVLGWVALSRVTDRCVYQGVAEVSVYVGGDSRGKGVGQRLLGKLIEASEANGIWTLNAAVFPQNKASIALHQKMGFRIIGYRERIAQRDGQWHDNVLLERRSIVVGV